MGQAAVSLIISFPDGDNYKELFGALDNAFLVAYAIGMFIRYLTALPSAHQFAPVCQETGFNWAGVTGIVGGITCDSSCPAVPSAAAFLGSGSPCATTCRGGCC